MYLHSLSESFSLFITISVWGFFLFGIRAVSFLIDSFSFESFLDRLQRRLEKTRNKGLMTCKIMHNTRGKHTS